MLTKRIAESIKFFEGKDIYFTIKMGESSEIKGNMLNVQIEENGTELKVFDENHFEFVIDLKEVNRHMLIFDHEQEKEELRLNFRSGIELQLETLINELKVNELDELLAPFSLINFDENNSK